MLEGLGDVALEGSIANYEISLRLSLYVVWVAFFRLLWFHVGGADATPLAVVRSSRSPSRLMLIAFNIILFILVRRVLLFLELNARNGALVD